MLRREPPEHTHLGLDYLLLLRRALAAPPAWAIVLGVQGVAAARKRSVQHRVLGEDLPPGQVNPRCTPQLEAHTHTHVSVT